MSDVDRIAEILRRHRRVLNLDSGTSHCFASRSGQCDFTGGVRADWEAHIAPLIDAALQPRIDTVEQLNALPDGTFVRSAYGQIFERRRGEGWWRYGASHPLPLEVPARVLYTPEGD